MEVPGKRPDITEIGAAAQLEGLCEACEADHVTTTANGICRECEQLMCDTCLRHHLKAKSCRQHVFVDTDQSVTPVQGSVENVEKFKRQTNEKIKYYCQKHEAVGCSNCMMPEDVLCRPENIKDSSKGLLQNEDFESLITKFESIMFANKENNKKVQERKKENENMLEKALKEIRAFRTKMNNYLDRAAESIVKEAKDIQRENGKLLVKLEQQCTILSTNITQMRNMLDTDLYQDSARFIQTVDFKSLFDNFEQEVTRIQTGNDIRTFEFIPDKQLQDIITSIKKIGSFGEIEIHSPTEPNTLELTKEVNREGIACDVKQTESVPRQKEKGQEQAQGICVGARVRPIGSYLRDYAWHYKGPPGTVTAVNRNGTVNVKWDATGETGCGYTMGLHIGPM